MAALGQISNNPVYVEGSKPAGLNVHQQLDIWKSFLNEKNASGSGKGLEDDRLTMSKEMHSRQFAPLSFVKTNRDGEVSIQRGPNYAIGAALSGFDVLRAINAKGLPFKIGKTGDLDVESARKALASVQRPSSAAVAWYAQAPENVAIYRMQAAEAMPVLAGVIAESFELSRAVDSAQSIQSLLTERTGLPKASLKRIGKLSAAVPASPIFETGERAQGEDALGVNRVRRFTVTGHISVDKALRYLSELPPDRTPKDDKEWAAYYDVLSSCAVPISNALNIPVLTILEASKGNWEDFKATLARAADFEPADFDRRCMALTTIDAIEAIESFSRTALIPQILRSIEETGEEVPIVATEYMVSAFEASSDLALGGAKNIAAHLLEIARRYAGRITTMLEIEGRVQAEDEGMSKYKDDEYPLLTGDYQSENGLTIRPLRNFEELKDEGRAMSHCVGGYTHSARRALCHLYSVRNEKGERLSTLELRGINGDSAMTAAGNIAVAQNRAQRNATPPDEARVAVEEFVRRIKSGDVGIRYNEIRAWREKVSGVDQGGPARTSKTTWASVLEFEWNNTGLSNRMWEEWQTVMGGKIGKSNNPGVIYTAKSSRSLLGGMNPRAAAILVDRARAAKEETPEPG